MCRSFLSLLVLDAPEPRRVWSKRYPLRTGGKKRGAFHFKVTTSSRQLSQIKRPPPGVNALTYVAPMIRFQEVIFDRTNPSSETPSVTLQVHGGSWCGKGLQVLMGLLHRVSSRCNTLLPPKEGECDHVLISLTPGESQSPEYSLTSAENSRCWWINQCVQQTWSRD